MALSRSLEKAQAVTMCQFCKESPEIKYECVNCDLLLCQLCNSTLHRKTKYSEHAVISLKDHGTTQAAETVRKVNLRNMSCDVHPVEKCCVFCDECEVPICSNCLTKSQSHSNHKFKELGEVYIEITSEMVAFTEMVENDLTFFKKEDTKLKSTLSQGNQLFEDARKEILHQEAKLKQVVTKQAEELLHDLETKWLPTEEKLRKELKIVRESERELESKKSSLEEVLLSHQAIDIFTTSKSLDKTLPNKTKTNINLEETKFIPAKEDNNSRDIQFGNLYQVPNMKMVQSFQSNLQSVTKILSLKDIVYIASLSSETLLQTDLENFHVMSEVKDIVVYDMALTNNGGVLISTGSNEIKLYQEDRQIKTFHSLSPLVTLGLYITKENDILVGLSESNYITLPKSDSIRKVISLTNDNDIKHTYEYDQHNQRLFTWPMRITAKDGLLCVVDLCTVGKEKEGRVVAIDKGGQLLWTYTGGNITPNQKFYPRDMTITSTGLLLITDCDNHALHVLTYKGETITYNCLKELKIELPLSLNIDRNGMLLIGCFCYKKNRDKRAMIYKVKLT